MNKSAECHYLECYQGVEKSLFWAGKSHHAQKKNFQCPQNKDVQS